MPLCTGAARVDHARDRTGQEAEMGAYALIGAAAVIVVVPPVRRRAVSVGQVAASTCAGVVVTVIKGATDMARAAVSAGEHPVVARGHR